MDLLTLTGSAAESPTAPSRGKHVKECRRRNVYMRVEGDRPVAPFFFDDSGLTLVCRTDLLSQQGVHHVAEHLARLYRKQGDGFVSELRGAFAIVLYDHVQRTLKAWIDHFGIERLLYAEFAGSTAVSTRMESVLSARDTDPSVSLVAVQEYLQYTCIPSPRTFYKDVFKLEPAHQLTAQPSATTRRYWTMTYDEIDRAHQPEKVWSRQTFEAVRSGVALSLKNIGAEKTPGCFLSGGTDSSSVAGFVAELTGESPRTFSIGFDDPRYNEIQYARIAAKHFHADHHEYFVKPEDIQAVALKASEIYDEPFGNSSVVPTYYCARLAAEHGVTHLLAGDGGDELFGGNSRYADDRVFQRYSRIPKWMRRMFIERIASRADRWIDLRLCHQAWSYMRRSNIPVPDRYFSYSLISSIRRRDIFADDFMAGLEGHEPLTAARAHFFDAVADNDLNRWLYLDLKITIGDNDLRKVMTMSQLCGVMPRFPLLNPDLAEFTGRIPSALKVHGSQLRYLFKRAMKDLLPAEIISKSKHGFGLPYSVWLADSKPLRDFTFDALGSARSRQRGYFQPGLLDWIWSQYQSVHRGYYGEILWLLLMLELWHVAHVDAVKKTEDLSLAAHASLNI